MTDTILRISVVIPTLNGVGTLPRLIEALNRQQGVKITGRYAIDSGSTDRTRQILEAGGYRVIQIPKADFNHGTTRNRLVEMAETPLVALFSQDAVPADSWMLAELAEPMLRSPLVAGAYARQIPFPGATRLDALRVRCSRAGRGEARRARGGDLEILAPDRLIERSDFHNAAAMVRRDGFLPFPAVEIAEDLLWARENLRRGRQIAFVPSARVFHSVERPLRDEWYRLGEEARVLGAEFGYRPSKTLFQATLNGLIWGTGDAASVWLTPGRAPVQSSSRAMVMGMLRSFSFWKEGR